MANLDLGSRAENGNWKTEANDKRNWIAIGKTSANLLKGTFEGNNYTIRGVYVNDESDYNGVFGNTSTVANLTVKNSYIEGGICTAGIVGSTRTGNVENCHNVNTTVVLKEGNYYSVGGVVRTIS